MSARPTAPAGVEVVVEASRRVVFGIGAARRAGEEVAALGRERALVVATPGRSALARQVEDALGEAHVATAAVARLHTPAAVSEATAHRAREVRADCVVAVGGGSAIGLAKGVAARTGIDQVVLPTTYAGSEQTDVLGEVVDGVKRTRSGPEIRPETIIYDPELTLALPVGVSVASAFNAMAHAVEALYDPSAPPAATARAAAGLAQMASALPAIAADPADPTGRAAALRAAWACGRALAGARMGLHHQLCHIVAGDHGLDHAATHTVLLPHVMAYNLPAAPAAATAIAAALDAARPAVAVRQLALRLGAPASLRALGLADLDVDAVVDRVAAAPYPNPRPLEPAALRALLTAALEGRSVEDA